MTRSEIEQRILGVVRMRRSLWKPGRGPGRKKEVAEDERDIAQFRELTVELTDLLRRYAAPVMLADGSVVRLNADGDGPAFIHRQAYPSDKSFSLAMWRLDRADERRAAEADQTESHAPERTR